MNKKTLKKTMLLTLLLYSIYIISSLHHSDILGNILSPIIDFFVLSILIKSYFNNKVSSKKSYKIIWLFYIFACLSWAIGDILWAVLYFNNHFNIDNNPTIICFYTLPNIFITLAVLIWGYLFYKRWNVLQFLLDSITIVISIAFLLWIIFFDKNIYLMAVINENSINSIISISCNILIITFLTIWYVSVRRGKISFMITILAAGNLLYSFSDLFYYYLHFNNLYIPNTFLDAAYLGSFLLFAYGSYININDENTEFVDNYAFGYSKKRFILFLCPLLVLLCEGFVINDILVFLVIILLYHTLGAYAQNYTNNEMLLDAQKKMNAILENTIAERSNEIIQKNKALEAKNVELEYLSKHDSVTNLHNRRYFLETIDKVLESVDSSKTIALLFIDIDRFKMINDLYGHHIGDQVLIKLASRLKNYQDDNCFLARLSGDEFVMILRGNNNYLDMEDIAASIINLCCEAIEIDQYVFHVSVSIGISIYPIDATDRSTLMRNADIAMYQAKAQGRKRYMSFDSSFKDRLNRKSEIELQLKRVNYSEFQLYYQPQFNIKSKKLIGAEALLRWKNKELGWISPAEFIPIAEELDLITSIGEWVIENAVRQIGIWNTTYQSDIKVGINVSPKQLDQRVFISDLKFMMHKYSVPPEYIDIELTESIAIEGEDRMKQIDSLFRGVGVSISIDDFGTGYSSLSYLKYFPFDRIKIAKQLVDAISKDDFDLQIVKAVILLAKSIGIKTIAEGVELEEQLDILTALGCDEIQGYLYGKPVPPQDFEKLFLSPRNE